MKNLNILTCLIGILILIGCSSSNEKIVKDYMMTNMNDPKSYDPIELKVVSTDTTFISRLPDVQEMVSRLSNLFERNSKLSLEFINVINKYQKYNLKELIDIVALIQVNSRYGTLTLSNLNSTLNNQKKLIEEMNKGFNILNKDGIDDMNILELQAQSEGISNRIDTENKILKETLNSYGIDPTSISKYKVVYHKYRGNNALGALIINESLFIIDNKSNTVAKVVDVQ